MIYIEDEAIKLDGVVLPGLVKSIEVKETARIDEQEVEGSATKPKQAVGYEDAKITVELILDDTETQTKYQRLEILRAVFRKADQSVPQPLTMVSEATAAHGVDKVLFKGLQHKVDNKKDTLAVSLELWEYIPQTIQTTSKSSASGNSGGSGGSSGSGGTKRSGGSNKNSSSAASKKEKDEAKKTDDSAFRSYLQKGRGKSPATDDAPPSKGIRKLNDSPLRGGGFG